MERIDAVWALKLSTSRPVLASHMMNQPQAVPAASVLLSHMARQRGQFLVRRCVPDLHHKVVTSSSEPLPVGTPGHRPDSRCMPAERGQIKMAQ